MNFDQGGMLPGPYEGPRIWARGVCPFDGYQLIETEPGPGDAGGWEHVIPPSEIPTMSTVLSRIAQAHGFEVAAAAEQIARDVGPEA